MTAQTESLLSRTKKLLKTFDLRPRKGLAQHFLVDGGIVKQILAAADLSPNDTVIEVGPGAGVLTEELVKIAEKVVAVELDEHFSEFLKDEFREYTNLTVINDDILETGSLQLLPRGVSKYKVVANLPYYITGAVIRHFLEANPKPERMVLMVQKEVAKQITAKPGELSLLGVSVQVYGEPKAVVTVPSRAFYPAPKVDSAVLRIDIYPEPIVKNQNVADFFRIVKAGFSANRKQLANSLAIGLKTSKNEIIPILAKAEIDPKRRAETLAIEEWARLTDFFLEKAL